MPFEPFCNTKRRSHVAFAVSAACLVGTPSIALAASPTFYALGNVTLQRASNEQNAVAVESGAYIPAAGTADTSAPKVNSLVNPTSLAVHRPVTSQTLALTVQHTVAFEPHLTASPARDTKFQTASNVKEAVNVQAGAYTPAADPADTSARIVTALANPASLADDGNLSVKEPTTSLLLAGTSEHRIALAASPSPLPSTSYGSGNATLQSEVNAPGYVYIQPNANVSVAGPVTINNAGSSNGANPVSLAVDGNLNVNGPASSLTLTSYGPLEVGYTLGSTGTLSITNGGKVNVNKGFIQAGWNEGSTGTITVSGQGSSLTAYGIIVGNGDNTLGSAPANGTLNIFNGASVAADIVALGNFQPATGVINISNATLTANTAFYANGGGSSQTNINSGGDLVSNGTIYLGEASSNTTSNVINLNQGGELDVNGTGGIVAQSGGQGSYAFNLAGGTLKIIGANLTTNANMYLVNNTNSFINTNGYTGTFSGVISGAGGLVKEGAGTLALTGANTYTGGMTILGGNVQLAPNSTSSVGPLALQASTSQQGGVTLGQLQTQGAAVLSQPLALALAQPSSGGQYVLGKAYQVLSANGGVSGKFSAVNLYGQYAQNLIAVPVYSQDSVSIELQATQRTIDTGHFYVTSGYAQNAALFDTLTLPLRTTQGYWLHGLGSFGHTPGVNYNYKGFVIGRSFLVNQHLTLGGGISNIYTHTGDSASSHIDGTHIGGQIYGVYNISKWTLTGVGIMGHISNRAERYLFDAGKGKFTTSGLYEGASFNAEYDALNLTHIFASPYGSISYVHTHTGSGQESGLGTMDMNYGNVNTSLAQIGFGLTTGYKSQTDYGNLSEWISLGGTGTLGNTYSRADVTIGLQHASVTGQIASPFMATPSAGIELTGNKLPFKLAAMWGGEFARRTSGQRMTIQASYKF